MIEEVDEEAQRSAGWIALALITAFMVLSLLVGCPKASLACSRTPDGTITCGVTVNDDGSKHEHVEKVGE